MTRLFVMECLMGAPRSWKSRLRLTLSLARLEKSWLVNAISDSFLAVDAWDEATEALATGRPK
jgi:hypothetical protein